MPDMLYYYEDREDLRIEMEDGETRQVVQTRSRGLSLSTGGRLFYQADPEPEDASRLARLAGVFLPRGRVLSFSPPPGGAGRELDPAAPSALLGNLSSKARHACPLRSVAVSASWVGFRQLVRVVHSERTPRWDIRRASRLRLEVRVEDRGKHSTAVDEHAFRPGHEATAEEFSERVVRRALERLDARPAPSGEGPVVFAAGVGGIFIHELVGHALEADTVLRGGSVLAVHEGALAPPEVAVVDDPRRGRAAWRVDDEGEDARAVSLVRDGKVSGWLLDLQTAARAGRPPTGHGRRASFQEPVRPRMGCTFLAPGPLSPDEVLQGTSSGVHVRRMEAAGTDPASGVAFFRVTDADRIHEGRLEAPLDPFLLRVAVPSALQNLDRIAEDLTFDTCIGSCVRDGQALATSVGAPTCRTALATLFPWGNHRSRGF